MKTNLLVLDMVVGLPVAASSPKMAETRAWGPEIALSCMLKYLIRETYKPVYAGLTLMLLAPIGQVFTIFFSYVAPG